MLIDCFIFYNELDILEYRLNLLKDIVDYFVLVESKFTFTGNPKELYFDKNKERFKNFKIKSIIIDDMPYVNPTPPQVWKNEKFQRNCISHAFEDINDDDYIIISDVDEIPDPETLLKIKNENTLQIGQLEQDFYYYNLDSKMDHNWYSSKILKKSKINGISCDDIRNTRFQTIPRGGWHLSYFGDSEFISNKIKNFSHQEYNKSQFTDISLIKERVDKKLDLFNRNINILPPNLNYLPPNFKQRMYCFIHSCNLPETGTQMLEYLLERIKNLPFETIFINNIGIPIKNEYYDNGVVLTNYSEDVTLFEIPTINKVREFSIKNPNCKVLYLHTKGITHKNKQTVHDWIEMMLYFLLDQKCIKNNYDTIGCNYHDGTGGVPKHYSGNFWWAKTDYLAKLPICGNNKMDAEFWLHCGNPNYLSLHNSGINHYYQRYPRKNYDFISKISSVWIGHRDFAEWLVSYLKPKTSVELGVDWGFSSFVFANALSYVNVFGKVYGIDLFTGERDTYGSVKENCTHYNINNLEIIKGDFTEVSKTWTLPIDILHIDGFHTYDAVKNDFTNWSKFVNENGIILFHDTAVEYFGIKDFFKELKNGYKLEFKHSAGLGIYTKNKELYQLILSTFDNVYGTDIIGFHACGHLCERGTDVAMFDYAYYNQKINRNKSIIFYENGNSDVIKKFENEFEVIKYNSFEEINNYNLTHFYNIKANNKPNQLTKFKNLSHIVFDIYSQEKAVNEIIAVISSSVKGNKTYPCIPHMINLPNFSENFRNTLGIPESSLVFGRHGGKETFDISYVHKAIKEILEERNDIYFLFMNTFPFYVHPRIFYIQPIINLNEKVIFINTCDAMIHARLDGESFGLSIGEFSIKNKPIITSYGNYNTHIDILGDRAIIYNSKESLLLIFRTFKSEKKIWNAYQEYTPEKVMNRFNDIFLNPIPKPIYIDMNILPPKQNLQGEITIVTAFFDIGRGNWNSYNRSVDYYLESFNNYLQFDYHMVVFIDSRYIHCFKNTSVKIFIPIDVSFLENNIHAWKNLELDRSIINSDKYKNLVKMRKGNPENLYSEYNCINHAKVDFLNLALPFIKTEFVCWSDFGYHSSIIQDKSRFPINVLDISKFNNQKINMCLKNKVEKYTPEFIVQNAPDIFTGSLYGLPVNLIPQFQELYHTSLDELYSLGISDDDQHVLLRCFYKNPDLFQLYLSENKWPDGLNYFQKNQEIFTKTIKIIGRESIVKQYIKNNFICVEIGTDSGDFAEFMLKTNILKLYCIDPYTSYDEYHDGINNKTGDSLYNSTKKRLNYDKVQMIRKFSHDALDDVKEQVDFIYIDGNHSYKYVLQDLIDWYPKLKPGGIIIGDDAVDIPGLLRENNDVFIDWGCKNCYGKYGVIKAFEDFSKIVNCKSFKVENQYILIKNEMDELIKNEMDEFVNIYKECKWGNNNINEYSGSSGPGSTIEFNIDYINFIKNFIKNNNINSVVDLGCGDFKIGNLIYTHESYHGYDIYSDIINYHKTCAFNSNFKFTYLDFFTEMEKIESSDLCIIKDVLQHWPLNSIYKFLDYLVYSNKFKYILICNCCNQTSDNTDIDIGSWRALSCDFYPLKKYNFIKKFNYHSKELSLIDLKK